MDELRLQLRGYRLTTAEILYRMPDFLHVIQTYIWQDLDLAPKYPRLSRFLNFWEANLDGPLYQVRVGSVRLLTPGEIKAAVDYGIQ